MEKNHTEMAEENVDSVPYVEVRSPYFSFDFLTMKARADVLNAMYDQLDDMWDIVSQNLG